MYPAKSEDARRMTGGGRGADKEKRVACTSHPHAYCGAGSTPPKLPGTVLCRMRREGISRFDEQVRHAAKHPI